MTILGFMCKVKGYEDNTIRPENNISREEFATLVIRALGIDISNADELNFADNYAISDWAKPYISVAVKII